MMHKHRTVLTLQLEPHCKHDQVRSYPCCWITVFTLHNFRIISFALFRLAPAYARVHWVSSLSPHI